MGNARATHGQRTGNARTHDTHTRQVCSFLRSAAAASAVIRFGVKLSVLFAENLARKRITAGNHFKVLLAGRQLRLLLLQW